MSAPTPTVLSQTPVTTNFNIVIGKIELTDLYGSTGAYLDDYNIPLAGVIGCFMVTAPDSTVIYNNTNFSAPDVNGATPRWIKSVSLPTNSDGSFVQGTYSIVYTARIDDGVNSPYDVVNSATYAFSYASPSVLITQTVDCVSPNFRTVDITNYVVNSITPSITRTMTLTFPVGSGGTGNPLTTSTNTISTGTFYQGPQTTTVSTVIVFTLDATGAYPTFTITDTVTGYKVVNVDCTFICSIYCCVEELQSRKEAARGVNDVQYKLYSDQFNSVMSLIGLAQLAIQCGESADVDGYLSSIESITNCTADCDCGEEPSLVIGLGGVANTVVVEGGGEPVVVVANTVGSTTTYTISLSSDFVDIVNSSYNTIITSDDNSITVTSSGTNPKTYDLSAAGLYTAPDRMELKVTITPAIPIVNSGSMAIVQTSVVITGTKFQAPTIAVDDPTNTNWLNIANAIKVSDFFTGAADNNYKILFTRSTEVPPLSFEKIFPVQLTADLFGRDDANGVFYFRTMIGSATSLYPPTNANMAGLTQEYTIVISE